MKTLPRKSRVVIHMASGSVVDVYAPPGVEIVLADTQQPTRTGPCPRVKRLSAMPAEVRQEIAWLDPD